MLSEFEIIVVDRELSGQILNNHFGSGSSLVKEIPRVCKSLHFNVKYDKMFEFFHPGFLIQAKKGHQILDPE
jgi:hypothetical protein